MSTFFANYPTSGAAAGSNPSVGPTGATAPLDATEVGFVDNSGNLQPFSGASSATGPNVAVTSSALPTGAATAANQVTQETTLSAIQANQTNGSQHTIVDSSALPTGAATSALQTSGNSSLTSILANQTNGTQVTKLGPNTNGQVNNSTGVGTSPITFTPPANAVGFIVEAESSNTVNLRYACGTAASTTIGMLLEPGRDSGYIPSSATVTVCAVSGSGQAASIQWVMSS